MNRENAEVVIAKDLEDLSKRAAELFISEAKNAISTRGRFSVALSGGSTPRALCSLLASDSFSERVDWANVHIFWGDERCVPPDHKDSNYNMARQTLIDQVSVPNRNVYRMSGENPDPHQAALDYEITLRRYFSTYEAFPQFDLIYLGMGDDGHTASLFPNTTALKEHKRWVVENFVEKLNTFRITLTYPTLNHGANIAFLISGNSKAGVLEQVLDGPREPERLPSQNIDPVNGKLLLFVDEAAAAEIHH